MDTQRNTTPTAAAEPADGTVPAGPLSPTVTVTHYQQRAAEFIAGFDKLVPIIPKLEAEHISTAVFVRSHQNVSIEFLAAATSAVEQTAELQGVRRLDVNSARDTLQFLEAHRPVVHRVAAFMKDLQFIMDSRQASLTAEALQIYDIAKGLARDSKSATIASLVATMKRDLGRRGRPRTSLALRKGKATPGIGVPTPKLLASAETEGERS